MIAPLTPDEALNLNGRPVTALDLAAARQQLAHDGTFLDRWDELSAEDHERAAIPAAAYLRALRHLLDGKPGYARRPVFDLDPDDCEHGRWNPDSGQCLDCGDMS